MWKMTWSVCHHVLSIEYLCFLTTVSAYALIEGGSARYVTVSFALCVRNSCCIKEIVQTVGHGLSCLFFHWATCLKRLKPCLTSSICYGHFLKRLTTNCFKKEFVFLKTTWILRLAVVRPFLVTLLWRTNEWKIVYTYEWVRRVHESENKKYYKHLLHIQRLYWVAYIYARFARSGTSPGF